MKNIVVTGITSGIGKVVAQSLLSKGHTVIANARNTAKAELVKQELTAATGNGNLFFYEADFSSFVSVNRFAERIIVDFPYIDILINNAGTWEMKFIETYDGLETNFQVNHLSPMLLTLKLLPAFRKAEKARIVNTSSGAHRRNILDLEDPEWRTKNYDGIATYSQSKLLNLLFSLGLQQLFTEKEWSNVTANTVHPGYVKSSLFDKMGQRDWTNVPNAEVGARSTLYAALSNDIEDVSGKYYYGHAEETNISTMATDESLAKRAWELSLKILSNKNALKEIALQS